MLLAHQAIEDEVKEMHPALADFHDTTMTRDQIRSTQQFRGKDQ